MYVRIALYCVAVFFFKQNTAYEMRISDLSSDVCSSDLHRRCLAAAFDRRLHALGDQLEALQNDRKAARFVDEVDGAPFQRRFLVDLVAQHGEKDHRGLDAALAHAPQHGQAVETRHAPVQQHRPGLLAGHHEFQRALAVGEVRSEEPTSELQSLMRISYAAFCLNKKTKT